MTEYINVTVQTTEPRKISVKPNTVAPNLQITVDPTQQNAKLSRDWAIGEGLIQNEDYSSKTWAGESKASADLSKMYSEAASLDLENLENKISIYDEQLNTTLAEGLDSISSAVTSGVGEIDTSKLNVLAQIEEVVNASIEDINATGIDTKVSKSGDTMTGTLIVESGDSAGIQLNAQQLDLTTTPTSAKRAKIQINDVNGTRFGTFECAQNADGSISSSVGVMLTKDDGSVTHSVIGPAFSADGIAYATAPTYTTYTDSSTKIATTAFLKNVLKGNGYGLASFSKSTHGHLTFDNGFVLQWGLKSTTSNKFALTYPKPFPTRTASIVITASNDNTDGTSEFKVSDVAKTGCNIRSSASTIGFYWFAIGY